MTEAGSGPGSGLGSAPRLDVLVPWYGGEAYLEEALRSLVAQTDGSWRATVVDDGHPDPEIVPAVLDRVGDPRIGSVRSAVNRGVRGAFQHCLDLARAEHVTFLGSDDRLRPDYVARVLAASSAGACVVQPGVAVIDAAGRPTSTLADRLKDRLRPGPGPLTLGGEDLVCSLLRGNWTYFPSLCWRRADIASLGFPGYEIVLDLALLVEVILAGGTLTLDPVTSFEYRRHAGSASAPAVARDRRFREERDLHAALAARLREEGMPRAARAARLRMTSRLHQAASWPGSRRRPRPVAAASETGRVVHVG